MSGTQFVLQGHSTGGGGGTGECTPTEPSDWFGVSPGTLCQRVEQLFELRGSACELRQDPQLCTEVAPNHMTTGSLQVKG